MEDSERYNHRNGGPVRKKDKDTIVYKGDQKQSEIEGGRKNMKHKNN
jgi:hypothetical protein